MNDADDAEWRRYAERLVDGLVRRGVLRDDRWRAALLDRGTTSSPRTNRAPTGAALATP